MYLDSIGSQQTYHVTLLAQPDDETAHFDQRHFEPAPYLKSGTSNTRRILLKEI
jgi:hypothetical protein